MKKVTVRDIANETNLSKSTVALALKDGYGVNEETRAKVLLKAYEMGYAVRGKAGGGMFLTVKNLTLVLSCSDLISASFWSDIINGIEVTCINRKINLSILVYRKNDDISVLLNGINRTKTQGLIIVNEFDNETAKTVSSLDIPCILVDPSAYRGMDITQVRASNFYGSGEMTQYLIACGFKNIAFWGALGFADSFFQRYNGVRSVINGNPDIIFTKLTDKSDNPNFPFANERQFKECFTKTDCPEALFCANDMLARTACETLKTLGLRVPEDVSVTGFDNLNTGGPPYKLTTVAIKRFEIGRIAVEEMINIITGVNYTPRLIEVGTSIVIGETVRAPVDKNK